jgi:hypothetical protein
MSRTNRRFNHSFDRFRRLMPSFISPRLHTRAAAAYHPGTMTGSIILDFATWLTPHSGAAYGAWCSSVHLSYTAMTDAEV